MLTGEAEPSTASEGDPIWAGTVCLEGAAVVNVTGIGADTMVGRMAEELRTAADRAVRPTAVDRIAPWFTFATLVVAAVCIRGVVVVGRSRNGPSPYRCGARRRMPVRAGPLSSVGGIGRSRGRGS